MISAIQCELGQRVEDSRLSKLRAGLRIQRAMRLRAMLFDHFATFWSVMISAICLFSGTPCLHLVAVTCN